MPIAMAHKEAIQGVLDRLYTHTTNTKPKRRLCEMFMDLPDRVAWAGYYNIITEPRSLNGIQEKLSRNRYRVTLEAFDDMSLVFKNAMYFNEENSQLSLDAANLLNVLEEVWTSSAVLPQPGAAPVKAQRSGPPARRERIKVPALPRPGSMGGSGAPANAKAFHARQNVKKKISNLMPPPPRPERPLLVVPLPQKVAPVATTEIEEEETGTPEPETIPGIPVAAEHENDLIVSKLDNSLPGWEGPVGEKGWMQEPADVQAKLEDIIRTLKDFRDNGYRSLNAVEEVPRGTNVRLATDIEPLTFDRLVTHVGSRAYTTAEDFDLDMARFFVKARRCYLEGSQHHGRVLVIQRLWQALTSSTPASIALSSVPAGPLNRNAKSFTSSTIEPKGRTSVDSLWHKGLEYRVGNYVHLMNPDDSSRPIVAQIWECWTKDGVESITVCWYYRAEQTVHPSERMFYVNEVFKSSHFVDHAKEDILEKVTVQFAKKYIQGRPRPPYWHPSWPLYICECRYNDGTHAFTKIKNFLSCVPPKAQRELSPLYGFEKLVYPARVVTPFLRGIKGPGRAEDAGNAERMEIVDGRRRPKRGGGTSAGNKNVQGNTNGSVSARPVPSATGPDRTVFTMAGGTGMGTAIVEKLPLDTTQLFDRDTTTNELLWFSGPPLDVARTPAPRYSLDYLYYLALEKKRKAGEQVDDALFPAQKRPRIVPPTVTDILQTVYGDSHHS